MAIGKQGAISFGHSVTSGTDGLDKRIYNETSYNVKNSTP